MIITQIFFEGEKKDPEDLFDIVIYRPCVAWKPWIFPRRHFLFSFPFPRARPWITIALASWCTTTPNRFPFLAYFFLSSKSWREIFWTFCIWQLYTWYCFYLSKQRDRSHLKSVSRIFFVHQCPMYQTPPCKYSIPDNIQPSSSRNTTWCLNMEPG